jgi:hypothetical protein
MQSVVQFPFRFISKRSHTTHLIKMRSCSARKGYFISRHTPEYIHLFSRMCVCSRDSERSNMRERERRPLQTCSANEIFWDDLLQNGRHKWRILGLKLFNNACVRAHCMHQVDLIPGIDAAKENSSARSVFLAANFILYCTALQSKVAHQRSNGLKIGKINPCKRGRACFNKF